MKSKSSSQRSLRISLTGAIGAQKPTRPAIDAAFRRFDSPFNEAVPPSLDRRRIQLADELRKAAINAIEHVTRCAPSSIGIAIEFARAIESIIAQSLEAETVPASENETSFKGNGPHTLRDCIISLEACRKHHRPPGWWNGERGVLESVNHKLDLLAGLLMRRSQEMEAWSAIGGCK